MFATLVIVGVVLLSIKFAGDNPAFILTLFTVLALIGATLFAIGSH